VVLRDDHIRREENKKQQINEDSNEQKGRENLLFDYLFIAEKRSSVHTHTQTHTILLREMRCSKMCFAILFCKQAEKYNIKEKINSQQEIIIIKKLFKN